MVELMMRRRALLAAGGGIPPEPGDNEYALINSYTSNAVWTCQEDGWYRVTCVGAGGSGGSGGAEAHRANDSNADRVYGSGGGGGGSGGCATSVLYLKKGTSLSISYNGNAQTAGMVNGENVNISATAGGIGNNGSQGSVRYAYEYDPPRYIYTIPNGGTGGSGGIASGGNKINSNGNNGGNGGKGERGPYKGGSSPVNNGNSSVVNFSIITNIPSNTGSGGRGGCGGYYNGTIQKPTSGSPGAAGGVFIEKGA